MNKKIFYLLLTFGIVLNLVLIGSYVINPLVSSDSGYYLAVAKDVYNGKVYFQEIGIPYNPLSIIFFGSPFLFDDFPNYRWHLIINILIIISSATIFYGILNKISLNKRKNLLFALLFLFITLKYDGNYLMLEPLSVFFQLFALTLYMDYRAMKESKNILFVGLLLSLSFLAKQYGLFLLLPILIDILVFNKSKLKSILLLGIGLLIPLTIFYIYLYNHGLGTIEFIKAILGKGVELDTGTGTGISVSVKTHLFAIIHFLLLNIYILIIPVVLVKYFKELDSKKILLTLLFLSSILVLVFAAYKHYFQYVIPYALLLFIYLFYNINNKLFQRLFLFLTSLSVLLFSVQTIVHLNRGNIIAIEKQNKEKEVLSILIPPKSKVYLDGPSPAHYYLCDFKSLDLKSISYSFPGYIYPETIMSKLKPGSFLVVAENKVDLYKELAINCEFEEITIGNDAYIVIKKMNK